MAAPVTKVRINKVKERILFLSPTVKTGQENEANLRDFDIGDLLGSGAFGSVYKVTHKTSKRIFALKVIRKDKIKKNKMETQIQNEVKIMYSLKSEFVVCLYNHFEDDENLYLVMEFAEEGQLMNKLKKAPNKKLSETIAAAYVRDLVSALDYIHNLTPPIIHRDIKPENLLVTASNRIKLGDFGWSNYQEEVARNTFCGTPEYLAPEMIAGKGHTEKLDIWCLGILMFEVLSGRTPFLPRNATSQAEAEKQLQSNIMIGKILFPSDYPAIAKDLTSRLLKIDPRDRIAIADIKKHPWFNQNKVFFNVDSKLNNLIPLETSDPGKLLKPSTSQTQISSSQPDPKIHHSLSQEKPAVKQKQEVLFDLEGKMIDESELAAQTKMPDLTDLEASEFFKRESILSAVQIPKLDKVKIQVLSTIKEEANQTTERKSIHMKNNEMIGKMNEQLMAKDNKVRELQVKVESLESEKQKVKSELEKYKSSFTASMNNSFDDSFNMDSRKLKMFEEERDGLKKKLEELYQVNSAKEELIDSLKNKVVGRLTS